MRLALPLVAAAAALTAAAVPAQAAVYPVCTVSVLHSDAGAPANTCTAGNSPQISGAITLRVLSVEVAAGAVHASLVCGYGVNQRSTSKTLYARAGLQEISVLENESTTCRNSLTPVADDTTAVGVSTYEYHFVGPGR